MPSPKRSSKAKSSKSRNILGKLKVTAVATTRNLNDMDMSTLIKTDSNFRLFRKALRLADLTDLLFKDSYTVFAPTDAAFMALGDPVVDFLFKKENNKILREVLLYHFTPKIYSFSSLYTLTTVPTLLDVRLPIDVIDITLGDIRLSDGVVHVVSDLLIPDYILSIIPSTTTIII